MKKENISSRRTKEGKRKGNKERKRTNEIGNGDSEGKEDRGERREKKRKGRKGFNFSPSDNFFLLW